MKNIRASVALFLLAVFLAGTAHANTSSVNPNVPAQNSPLSSSVLRGNFANTQNDLNTIFGILALSSNELLGTVNAGNAGPLNLPTCSTGALSWTPGSGFGCNSLSGLVSPVTVPLVFTGAIAFDLNAASLPTKQTGTTLQLGNADTITSRVENDCFSAPCHFTGVRFDGTNASPTTLQANDEISSFNAFGYNGASVVGPKGSVGIFAAQNWTNSATGTYISLKTALDGTTSQAEAMRIENDGGATFPATVTGGSKGLGNINAAGVWVNGVAVLTGLPSQNANTVLGAATTGVPSGLAMPSCSTGTSALTWTSGIGFGCNSISAGGSVSVTAGSSNLVVSPSPGTGTFTVDLANTTTQTGTATAATHNATSLTSAYQIAGTVIIARPDSDTSSLAIGGALAGQSATSSNNLGIGSGAGSGNTSGINNMYIGLNAGSTNATGNQNVVIGNTAAFTQTAANDAVMIGYGVKAGFSDTVIGWDAGHNQSGNNNKLVLIGAGAGSSQNTGTQNTYVGYQSGSNGQGSNNTALGYDTLSDGTGPSETGSNNTALGANVMQSLQGVTTGDTGVGASALGALTTASADTAVGASAGAALTTGSSNTILGNSVGGVTLTTGSSNILIGTSSAVDAPSSSTSSWMNIGNSVMGSLTAPTISSGFGTSPSVVNGTSSEAFTINVGTGGSATSGVVAFAVAAPHGYACDVVDQTTNSSTVFITKSVPTSTTTSTFTNYNTSGTAAAWVASDVLVAKCNAF